MMAVILGILWGIPFILMIILAARILFDDSTSDKEFVDDSIKRMEELENE